MVLTNDVVISLNEITTQVNDKTNLSENDIKFIKNTFNQILERGSRYDVADIETWFENEGSWVDKQSVIRITNLSHYVLSRFQQSPKKFKIISNPDDCSCH